MLCVPLRLNAVFRFRHCDVALSSCLEQRPDPDADESCSRQVIQVFHADMLGDKASCQHTDSRSNDQGHGGPDEHGPFTDVPVRGKKQCCQLRLVTKFSDKHGRKDGKQYLEIHIYLGYTLCVATQCCLHRRAVFERPVEDVIGPFDFRSSFLITSFRPDHTSSTAHTFTSTRPKGSASFLMVSSVMSVGTLADFFGHETQIIPSCLSLAREARSVFAR